MIKLLWVFFLPDKENDVHSVRIIKNSCFHSSDSPDFNLTLQRSLTELKGVPHHQHA